MMAQPIFMERLTVFQPKKSLSHNTIIIETSVRDNELYLKAL